MKTATSSLFRYSVDNETVANCFHLVELIAARYGTAGGGPLARGGSPRECFKRPRIAAAVRRAIVAALRRNCSRYVDIARRFGVSLAFVSICAKRAGISRRRTKRPA
jgi:hypothetical protein